jgi:hypothetical protein
VALDDAKSFDWNVTHGGDQQEGADVTPVLFCIILLSPQASTASRMDNRGVISRLLKLEAVSQPFYGEVVFCDATRITIKSKARGEKSFVASPTLASGAFPKNALPNRRYRLADVQVKDQVHISFSRFGGVEFCDEICIHRRPGGEVPRCPGEDEDSFDPWHKRANAYQQWEEKGTPLPPKYAPPILPKQDKPK